MPLKPPSLPRWTTVVPVLAVAALVLTWGRDLPAAVLVLRWSSAKNYLRWSSAKN